MKITLDEKAIMPTRAHDTDAGIDLYAPFSFAVEPHGFLKVNLGVHVQIPQNCVGLITSKSGLMSKGITCRGTIDCGYTGPINAVVYNHSDNYYIFEEGDKVTQLVVLPCVLAPLELVDSLEDTERGADGFGSTGK